MKGSTVVLQKPIEIDRSSIQNISSNMRIARVLGDGAYHHQAMDFAKKMGREPTKADIEQLSAEAHKALGQTLYEDGVHGVAHLKDESVHSTKERPLYWVLDTLGKGWVGFVGGTPDVAARWVLWIELPEKAEASVLKPERRIPKLKK